MKGKCPIKDCTAVRLVGHLMCFEHWYQVPPIVREEVWNAERLKDPLLQRLAARKAIEHVTALDRQAP